MVNYFVIKEPRQFNEERVVFSTNNAGITEYPHEKYPQLLLYIIHKNLLFKWNMLHKNISYTKIYYLKWNINLNIIFKYIKLIEENIAENISDLG